MAVSLPLIYLTAHADEATIDRAKVTEPSGYIFEPVNEWELHAAIELALCQDRMEEPLKERRA